MCNRKMLSLWRTPAKKPKAFLLAYQRWRCAFYDVGKCPLGEALAVRFFQSSHVGFAVFRHGKERHKGGLRIVRGRGDCDL